MNMILHQSWIFLFTILVLTISAGLLTIHFKGTGLFEGLTDGPTNPAGTTRPTGWINPTTPPSNNLQLVFSNYYNAIIAVIDQNNNAVDYNNNIVGIINNVDKTVVDGMGNIIGALINSDDISTFNMHVIDETKNIIGIFNNNRLWNGVLTGTFNITDGSLRDRNNIIIGFSLSASNITPNITHPYGTSPFQYFNGDLGNDQGGGDEEGSYDMYRGRIHDYKPPRNGKISIINNDRNNLEMQNGMYRDDDIASFNYDALYNTDNLSPKYSFTNSSFLYKSYLTDENDYLNEVYFNKNPLELEKMCKGLDNTTCGLTSTCVFVGDDKCVPGNKRGPYTVYSDINLDYYYYKGKCYGNCPGQFYPGNHECSNTKPKKTKPTNTPTTRQTTSTSTSTSTSTPINTTTSH